MAKVVAIREKLKREYADSHGVKLTYLPFIVRAAVDALGKWPRLNAELRGDTIVTKSAVNLGIAVALDDGKGLIVPVIRNAEEKNLLGIARSIADLAERARTKKLLPDDVQGGTFTITNPGGFGAIAGTPIINQPQVGILDVEAIVKRPVVIADEHGNDMIAIRPMMNLCLSYDHRLVDGAYAAPFMRDLRINPETWDEGGLMLSETDFEFMQANVVPLDEPFRRLGRDLGDKVTAKSAEGAYLLCLGPTPYGEALELQRSLAAAVTQGAIPETIVLLEHPPTVTVGRRDGRRGAPCPSEADVDVLTTDRGGKSTYHAPGQLVCYPILDLNRHGRDVKRYCRDPRGSGHRNARGLRPADRIEGLTGVWLTDPPRKIASIGVHISRCCSTATP